MSAFDAKNRIARAVADPQTDHKLPSAKSLSWKAITTPVALAGTSGTHCELVHGDSWRDVAGYVTENVTFDVRDKILGNHFYSLTGNRTENVVGNINSTVIGAQIMTNFGPQTGTHLAPVIDTYRTNVYIDHNCDWLEEKDKQGFRGIYSLTEVIHEIDLAMIHIEGQAFVAMQGASMWDFEFKSIHLEEHAVHIEEHASGGEFYLLRAKVAAAEADAGAGKVSVKPHAGLPPHGPLFGSG